jgi:hypothetical protein
MELGALYDLAEQENIEVIRFPMAINGSMSVMDDNGACYIGMDDAVRDGGIQERVHLIHELGHCVTGSFYNRYAAIDSRQRHENRADKWAVKKLIPVEALDDASLTPELSWWFGDQLVVGSVGSLV